MSAACKITAVLHIAEVEGFVFSSFLERQDLCYMVCLSLPSGLGKNSKMRRAESLYPPVGQYPIKIPMAVPLDQYVLLMYQFKGTH